MSHQVLEDSDSIFIPQEARGKTVAEFPKSVRLAHVLQAACIRLIGDLHGLTYSGFAGVPNCGQKTLQELRALVRKLQLRESAPSLTAINTALMPPKRADYFLVATSAELLSPFELPISQRLGHVLRSKGIVHLANLQRLPFSELLEVKGCGRKVIGELVRLLERVAAAAFSPSQIGELLRSIDMLVAKLSPRNQNILLLRLGATDNRARTLEEVGSRFKLTCERVRQMPAILTSFSQNRRLRYSWTAASGMVVPSIAACRKQTVSTGIQRLHRTRLATCGSAACYGVRVGVLRIWEHDLARNKQSRCGKRIIRALAARTQDLEVNYRQPGSNPA